MILTGPEIIRQHQAGKITIEPFTIEQINPNSYNYRLGRELIVFEDGEIDPRSFRYKRIALDDNGYVLRPNRLYLASTLEVIGSSGYVTSLIGRSTMGRLGLWLQITADLGHIGNHHNWTLELKVVKPLRIFPGMVVGQVTFWRYFGKTSSSYHNKYANDRRPTLSRIIQNDDFKW